jgi:2-polyprenyl-3-methyl-5-hydroxy-6-metoxy-1,4-benzoquinol methylase
MYSLFVDFSCDYCSASLGYFTDQSKTIEFQNDYIEKNAFSAKVYSSNSSKRPISQKFRCKNCGLMQLAPRYPASVLEEAYAYSDSSEFSNPSIYRARTFKRAIDKISHLLPPKDSHVLDVGCGSGEFVQVMKSIGYKAIGLEPNKKLSEIIRKKFNVTVLTGTLENIEISDKFEIITMWDVLEHVNSPKKTLMRVSNMMAKSRSQDSTESSRNYRSILILNLPMIDTFPAKFLRKFWPFYLEVHLFYFTLESIEKYTTELGLELISTKRFWQTLTLRYLINRQFGT